MFQHLEELHALLCGSVKIHRIRHVFPFPDVCPHSVFLALAGGADVLCTADKATVYSSRVQKCSVRPAAQVRDLSFMHAFRLTFACDDMDVRGVQIPTAS
jgi:hypothetical protein